MKKEIQNYLKNTYYKKEKSIYKQSFSYKDIVNFTEAFYKQREIKKLEANNTTLEIETPLHIIHKAICEYFGCDLFSIFKRTRKSEFIKMRQWFHYMSRYYNREHKVSYAYIGAYYSDVTLKPFNHATVMHSCKTISGYVEVDRKDLKVSEDLHKLIIKIKNEEKMNKT